MNDQDIPVAVVATEVALRAICSSYPEPFASRMKGREKRPAGDAVLYPDDDIQAIFVEGKWQFAHKDGTPH